MGNATRLSDGRFGRALRWAAVALVVIGAVRAETLRVATYNLSNYNLENRMADGVFRREYPKPESEKTALRRVIREIDADVLALQEMGGPAFLRELQRDLRSEGVDYPHTAILETGGEPRYLAVLSRRPLQRVGRHTDLTFPYFGGQEQVRRGLLEVRLESGGREVVLFVVHLKSRYTERPDDPAATQWRNGEAVAARDRILAVSGAPTETAFLVLGDFNAAPRDRAVRAFLEKGERELSRLLPAEDSRGERWTHVYRRDDSYSRVDHALASRALVDAATQITARIHDGEGVREASDHRPVVVTIEW